MIETFDPAAVAARQEIEYLRRHYAYATDLLCNNSSEAHAEARTLYHRIFTPDAISRAGDLDNPLVAHSPDGWADVVGTALAKYETTQHLIGSQIVEIETLETGSSGAVTAGTASMKSYLQAWHVTPEKEVWIFVGTYHDKARFVPGTGWQIYDMTLERTTSDTRALSPDPE